MNAVTVLPPPNLPPPILPRRRVALAVPVAALAVLALPLTPFLALGLFAVTDRPFRAAGGLWRLLTALGGTEIQVDSPHTVVAIRLF